MNLELDIQNALDVDTRNLPLPSSVEFEKWVQATLTGRRKIAQLTIRIVTEPESASLNETYRHKQGPTNVLSFPFECPPEVPIPLLGDLVICAPVVTREASEQEKDVMAHWAHMTIHGVLHLLGFDHNTEQEAAEMEAIEITTLANFGFANPYEEIEQ